MENKREYQKTIMIVDVDSYRNSNTYTVYKQFEVEYGEGEDSYWKTELEKVVEITATWDDIIKEYGYQSGLSDYLQRKYEIQLEDIK